MESAHDAEGGGGDRAPAAGPEAGVSGPFDFRRRSDARLLARAVREGWPVPPHRRPELVAAASEAAADPATPARAVVAVARAFLAMSEANLAVRRALALGPPRRDRRVTSARSP
jgi:hypothetical protein